MRDITSVRVFAQSICSAVCIASIPSARLSNELICHIISDTGCTKLQAIGTNFSAHTVSVGVTTIQAIFTCAHSFGIISSRFSLANLSSIAFSPNQNARKIFITVSVEYSFPLLIPDSVRLLGSYQAIHSENHFPVISLVTFSTVLIAHRFWLSPLSAVCNASVPFQVPHFVLSPWSKSVIT